MGRLKAIAEAQGEAAAERFEADCLSGGWITPKSKGGRRRDDDPFDVIAAKIVAEAKGLYTPAEAEDVVKGGDDVIKKAVPTRNKNGGTNSGRKKGTR